jgi:hypothetical protein
MAWLEVTIYLPFSGELVLEMFSAHQYIYATVISSHLRIFSYGFYLFSYFFF